MVKFVIFICIAVCSFSCLNCRPDGISYIKLLDDVVYTVDGNDNLTICSSETSRQWSYDFHNCFIDKKYQDGGRDLNNIVDRILHHSKDCIDNSTKNCRPDYNGFMVIMDKMIAHIKDYSHLYLDDIKHGREQIKDLDCVEESISKEKYAECFKPVFKLYSTEENFVERAERAISCTNKYNRLCSNIAKTTINRLVRDILNLKKPKREEFDEEVKPTKPQTTPSPPPPPKKWYDYIFQPFVSFWNTVKSWFGF